MGHKFFCGDCVKNAADYSDCCYQYSFHEFFFIVKNLTLYSAKLWDLCIRLLSSKRMQSFKSTTNLLFLFCRVIVHWSWSELTAHRALSVLALTLSESLHHILLDFVYTLNLLLRHKLRVFLIILLSYVKNLLAHFEALLDVLPNLLLIVIVVATRTRTKSPNLLLALCIGVNELGCSLVVKSKVIGYILSLFF